MEARVCGVENRFGEERASYEAKLGEMQEREELVGLVHESFEERLRVAKLDHLKELATVGRLLSHVASLQCVRIVPQLLSSLSLGLDCLACSPDSLVLPFVISFLLQAKAEARLVTSNLVNVAQSRLEETVSGFRQRKQRELVKISRIFDRQLRSKVTKSHMIEFTLNASTERTLVGLVWNKAYLF